MGIVYEGKDPNLDRRVAIKTVKVENLSEEAAAEYEHRFRTEARSAARLQHPNIVSVYDSDRDGDIAFLVMEFIQGDDLKQHLDHGTRYSLEQSLKIIRDLLSALDYAHKQGIVHRDIKPANLLIEPSGRVKLTDFGVARIQDSGEATRTQGSMVGTLKYMSPEQVQGQKVDARADLFSVGVVLYQLLTDKRPFDGDNDFSIIHAIIGHDPPPPSSVNPRLPNAIDAVVARALAKSRDERFASARDFAVALQSAIRRAEDQTVVPPADPTKKPDRGATNTPGAMTSPGGRSVPGSPGASSSVPGNLTSPGSMSTVTQEVELVYWKDIKESNDPEEFHAFLERFPAGIYADLARRRLRKLLGGGDSTVLGEPDLEATRMRPADSSRPPTKDAVSAGPGASGSDDVLDDDSDWTPTVVEPLRPDVAEAAAAAAAAAAAGSAEARTPGAAVPSGKPSPAAPASDAARTATPGTPASTATATPSTPSTPSAQPAKKKPPIAVLAGVAALVVIAGIGGVMMAGKKAEVPPDAALAAASAPASGAVAAASVPVPAASTVAAAASAEAAAAASAAASEASAAAAASAAKAASLAKHVSSAPRKQASKPVKPEVQPVEPPRSILVAPVMPQPQASRPTFAPPPPPTSNDFAKVDECKDKVFLSRELCLAEHCDKPGARNHPLCVKRREDARLREESKVRQGPQQSP